MHRGWVVVRIAFACVLLFPGLFVLIAGVFFDVSLDHRVLAAGSIICGIALLYVAHSLLKREDKMSELAVAPRSPYHNMAFHEIEGRLFVVITDKDGKFVAERELPKGWTVQAYIEMMGKA